uniref:Bm14221 n=1 Tax=Brugia malayi TaxID=6279 RepID=A0A1I9G321_BRUMA|nr:Bm14221 [Brugia malayi]
MTQFFPFVFTFLSLYVFHDNISLVHHFDVTATTHTTPTTQQYTLELPTKQHTDKYTNSEKTSDKDAKAFLPSKNIRTMLAPPRYCSQNNENGAKYISATLKFYILLNIDEVVVDGERYQVMEIGSPSDMPEVGQTSGIPESLIVLG